MDRSEDEENVSDGKSRILHLTPDSQTSCLTHLSLYYVSSLETIEMVAIALLGLTQHSKGIRILWKDAARF